MSGLSATMLAAAAPDPWTDRRFEASFDAESDSDSNSARVASQRSWHFEVRERWEGTVESVASTYFVARLVNMATNEPATAMIYMDDVPADDLALVEPGNLFFWHVGYRTQSGSQREKISRIRFRRGLGIDSGRIPAAVRAHWLDAG